MANDRKNMKQLVGAIERGEGDDKKTYWTRIGVAFENRDGSWNLRFDFVPAGLLITEARCKAVAFSQPITAQQDALYVVPGNPKKLTGYDLVAQTPDIKLAVPCQCGTPRPLSTPGETRCAFWLWHCWRRCPRSASFSPCSARHSCAVAPG